MSAHRHMLVQARRQKQPLNACTNSCVFMHVYVHITAYTYKYKLLRIYIYIYIYTCTQNTSDVHTGALPVSCSRRSYWPICDYKVVPMSAPTLRVTCLMCGLFVFCVMHVYRHVSNMAQTGTHPHTHTHAQTRQLQKKQK